MLAKSGSFHIPGGASVHYSNTAFSRTLVRAAFCIDSAFTGALDHVPNLHKNQGIFDTLDHNLLVCQWRQTRVVIAIVIVILKRAVKNRNCLQTTVFHPLHICLLIK